MKAIHLVPASVLALAIGVTGMAALAQDGQRQGATNASDPFMIDFKWEAEAKNTPAPPQIKFDGIDGESNDAVMRNPTAAPQSTQTPKPDSPQGNNVVTFEDVLISSQVVPATPRDVASGKATGERRQAPGTSQDENKLGNFEIQDVRGSTVQPGVSVPQAQYNPKEVGIDKIQSPRDPASERANAANITFTDIVISSATAPNTLPGQSNMGDTATHEKGARSAIGPDKPSNISEANALWQLIDSAKQDGPPAGQSQRDLASGQASTARISAPDAGNSFTGGQDTRIDAQVVGNGAMQAFTGYHKIEGVDGEAKVKAAPGAGEQFISGGSDGQGIRKPRPNNRPRKGKRMHKP